MEEEKEEEEELANDESDLEIYQKYMFYDELEGDDPEIREREAHDYTLAEMKEELYVALSQRKSKTLRVALTIFNKIQQQSLKVLKLDDINSFADINTDREQRMTEIDQALKKF